MGSTEKLLFEIQKKFNLHLDPQNLIPGISVHDILESDMFGFGLGCKVISSWAGIFYLNLFWSTVLN